MNLGKTSCVWPHLHVTSWQVGLHSSLTLLTRLSPHLGLASLVPSWWPRPLAATGPTASSLSWPLLTKAPHLCPLAPLSSPYLL